MGQGLLDIIQSKVTVTVGMTETRVLLKANRVKRSQQATGTIYLAHQSVQCHEMDGVWSTQYGVSVLTMTEKTDKLKKTEAKHE